MWRRDVASARRAVGEGLGLREEGRGSRVPWRIAPALSFSWRACLFVGALPGRDFAIVGRLRLILLLLVWHFLVYSI